jgi:hypothetical protein
MPRRERFKKKGKKGFKVPEFKSVSLGEIYKGIRVPERITTREETRLVKRTDTRFVRFCKWAFNAMPSLGKGAKFKPKYREAIAFLGWDLNAEQFNAGIKMAMILSLFITIIGIFLVFLFGVQDIVAGFAGSQELAYFYIFLPFILLVFFITRYVQNFPITAAEIEKLRALTYVPEIVGYLIMSMKLVPNLEKAVEFAATHGTGKIAEDFKRIIWDLQLGVYNTLAEALDDLAYRWGKFSEEFKQALMMIRASVLENTEAKRFQMLDKTMDNVLNSIQNKMEQYARSLSQPTIVLFYIAVLLPLILIIILPVGSAFTGGSNASSFSFASPIVLLLVYNILIPGITIFYILGMLKKRPPTYEPPVIPDNHPLIPPKNKMKIGETLVDIRVIVVIVLIAGFIVSSFLSQYGIEFKDENGRVIQSILPPDKTFKEVVKEAKGDEHYFDVKGVDGAKFDGALVLEFYNSFPDLERARNLTLLEKQKFLLKPENDITPNNFIFGMLITISIAAFIYLYYNNIYKKQVQEQFEQMESEFKDSLYVLASRLGENRPVEEALQHTKEFLPHYRVSRELFGRTIDNINLLGMPLETAVFDPTYGALKYNPSKIIRSSMQLLVDSVNLGVNVAARSLISLSLQLSNSEKVSKMLSTLVSDITSMMKTMAVFIAPVVLGITTSLQRIVMLVLGNIATQNTLQSTSIDLSFLTQTSSELGQYVNLETAKTFSSSITQIGSLITPEAIAKIVSPSQFILIVTVYVIELVIILMYFTTKIEEDNEVLARVNIAKALPIAVTVFVLSVIASKLFVGGFGF